MALANKGELKAAIARRAYNRTDLDQDIDDLIVLAEEAMNNGTEDFPALRIALMIKTEIVAISAGVGALPDDFLQIADGVDNQVSPQAFPANIGAESLFRRNPYGTTGTATEAAVQGTNLYVGPGVTSGAFALTYYAKIEPLTSTDDINVILTNYPSLYLRACLMNAGDILQSDELLMKNAKWYRSMVVGLNQSDTLARYANVETSIPGLVI